MQYNRGMSEQEPPAPAHPAWYPEGSRGRPGKFVTEDCQAFCADCDEWQHLSKFYLKGGPRYSAELGQVTTWYGSPGTYCTRHHLKRQARAREKRREDIAEKGRWDAFNAGVPTPKISANYPPLSVIRDVLTTQYEVTKEDVTKFTTDDLFTLWDKILLDREDIVEPDET